MSHKHFLTSCTVLSGKASLHGLRAWQDWSLLLMAFISGMINIKKDGAHAILDELIVSLVVQAMHKYSDHLCPREAALL
jgi:hypothetical protein